MTGQNPPKVSVCIPAYNYGRYIGDAIHSVLRQTYDDLELVIVDNASVDDTREIAESFVCSDDRIRYIRNETTVAMAENWNRCLIEATGVYVNILCADDLLEPQYLQKTVEILDAQPDVILVSCGRLLVTEDLGPLSSLSFSDRPLIENGYSVINTCLREGNRIGEPSSAIFRRTNATRGFHTGYRQIVDLEMWFHLLEQGNYAFIPEKLCMIRQHRRQCTKSNITSLDFADDEFRLLHEYMGKDYVNLSRISKQRILFDRAMLIWSSLEAGIDPRLVKEKIRKNYSLLIFHVLFGIVRMYVFFRRMVTGKPDPARTHRA